MLPFSGETYITFVKNYNLSIWPAQIFLGLIVLACFWLANRSGEVKSGLISALLALSWIWTGIIFHMFYFTGLIWAGWHFGVLFLIEAALLIWFGVVKNRLEFGFNRDVYGMAGMVLVAVAVLIYPMIGVFEERLWAGLFLAGVMPAPTVSFTLGMLLLTKTRLAYSLFVIPVLWSLVSGLSAVSLGVLEDLILLPIVLTGVVFAIGKNYALAGRDNIE